MRKSRLTQALDEGAVELPQEGKIAVFGPPVGFDLSAIDRDRLIVVSRFRPEHDYWAARGFEVKTEAPKAEASIVCLPRAKNAAQFRLISAVSAVPLGAPILVDGQKSDGIDSVLKQLKGQVDLGTNQCQCRYDRPPSDQPYP